MTLRPGQNLYRMVREIERSIGKLSDEDVIAIRENPEGLTVKQLAEKYGVAVSAIQHIRGGHSWKRLLN